MNPDFAERYGYWEEWHWWFRARQRIIESLLRRELSEIASPSIISVGCGPLEGLKWLPPIAGENGRVVGLDAEPLHASTPGKSLNYVVGRIEEAPFASSTFDAVLALDVLEHLDDDVKGIGEMFRLLKPGGLLLLTVPAFPSLWGAQDIVSQHRRRYTKRTLSKTFNQADLPIPWITYFNTLLFPPIAAVRWGRKALGMANSEQGDFEGSRPGILNDILEGVFASERHIVCRTSMPFGVSLLAMLRR
jgi:SAM-dependent methyltransferase